MQKQGSKAPELLEDLAQHVASCLMALGVSPEEASKAGRSAATYLADHWGGQNIYVPMAMHSKLQERNRQIWNEYKGDNHAQLARRYKMSVQRIYRIVEQERQAEFHRNQRPLFDE